MNWLPSKVGAEPKKIVILAVLLAAAGVVYWIERTPSVPEGTTASTAAAPSAIVKTRDVPDLPAPPERTLPARSAIQRSMEDFRPTLKLKEGTDVSKIDPTLKLDLLAKVQQTPMEGGTRSLFEFGMPPPPPAPPVKPIKPGPVADVKPQAPPKPQPPVKPPPPPITLKFYGYAGPPGAGPRRAFFLDGDPNTGDIFVAGENDLVKNRYKIVRIGVNSAVVEDTTDKNQQTLPLVRELGG
ncbi:MAG TPA: hypothetical protein VFW83_10920 [Bryobacteraceae bacterium]|nr:hypothetical protein [Bryobacteraceae bacterium]